VAAGVDYRVDCIIYASGFEVGTPFRRRAGYEVRGRDGVKLSDAWAEGMRTKHGIHVHGFPNAFIVQISQGANLVANVPHNFIEAGTTIAMIVRHTLDSDHREVEVTREAQDAWMELLFSNPLASVIGSPDCTPGYYNNEGQPGRVDWWRWTGRYRVGAGSSWLRSARASARSMSASSWRETAASGAKTSKPWGAPG